MSSVYEPLTWMVLLRTACAASSKATVARRLGLSRTTVSLVLSGKYDASTKRISEQVMQILGSKQCPLHGKISLDTCQKHKERPMPTSSPLALRQWRACQNCNQ